MESGTQRSAAAFGPLPDIRLLLPEEITRITATARQQLNTGVGIHTHDDIGLGVANALA